MTRLNRLTDWRMGGRAGFKTNEPIAWWLIDRLIAPSVPISKLGTNSILKYIFSLQPALDFFGRPIKVKPKLTGNLLLAVLWDALLWTGLGGVASYWKVSLRLSPDVKVPVFHSFYVVGQVESNSIKVPISYLSKPWSKMGSGELWGTPNKMLGLWGVITRWACIPVRKWESVVLH